MTHFLMHMGLAGLACAWRLAQPETVLHAPAPVYHAIALATALLFSVWLCLYAAKCVMYPQKVAKEWQCNLRGNAFVVPWVSAWNVQLQHCQCTCRLLPVGCTAMLT